MQDMDHQGTATKPLSRTGSLSLWKFVAENHTENFATLKITLKNNIKEGLLKITLKRGLYYSGVQKWLISIQTKYHLKSSAIQ